MRISDWSSDVCSSDLLANIGQEAFAVDRTVEDARRGEPIAAQGAQEGHGAPVAVRGEAANPLASWRSEEHTSELQSLMRISYAVFCLKKKKHAENLNAPRRTSHPVNLLIKPVHASITE